MGKYNGNTTIKNYYLPEIKPKINIDNSDDLSYLDEDKNIEPSSENKELQPDFTYKRKECDNQDISNKNDTVNSVIIKKRRIILNEETDKINEINEETREKKIDSKLEKQKSIMNTFAFAKIILDAANKLDLFKNPALLDQAYSEITEIQTAPKNKKSKPISDSVITTPNKSNNINNLTDNNTAISNKLDNSQIIPTEVTIDSILNAKYTSASKLISNLIDYFIPLSEQAEYSLTGKSSLKKLDDDMKGMVINYVQLMFPETKSGVILAAIGNKFNEARKLNNK